MVKTFIAVMASSAEIIWNCMHISNGDLVSHSYLVIHCPNLHETLTLNIATVDTVQIFIDFRVCDFAFAPKTQNAPCVSRFKRVLFSDRFQFAF